MTNDEGILKLKRAIIKLQRTNPFFAYLSLSLDLIESKDEYPTSTMAVDVEGNLYYNPSFILELTDNEMMGVLVHEIMHLVLMHLTRGKEWERLIGNIACDICVNEVLKENNFILPDGAIWSDYNHEITLFKEIIIKDCNKKTAEEIYYEIMEKAKKKVKELLKSGKAKIVRGNGQGGIPLDEDDLKDYEIEATTNDGSGKAKNLDRHIKSKNGEVLTKEEKEKIDKKWVDKIHEAYSVSRIAGNIPVGIERIIGKLHESKVDWRHLLLRNIQNYVPRDFDYSRPNKKSISCGVYMPDTTREKVEIAIAIDVSGSIQQEELRDFLSEIVGIAKAYRDRISMTLFTHETQIVDEWEVENGSVAKILALKIRGGGGTSFTTPYKQFMDKHKSSKLLLWMTDGFGDEIKRKDLKNEIIWILCKNGSDNLIKNSGKVINLK